MQILRKTYQLKVGKWQLQVLLTRAWLSEQGKRVGRHIAQMLYFIMLRTRAARCIGTLIVLTTLMMVATRASIAGANGVAITNVTSLKVVGCQPKEIEVSTLTWSTHRQKQHGKAGKNIRCKGHQAHIAIIRVTRGLRVVFLKSTMS